MALIWTIIKSIIGIVAFLFAGCHVLALLLSATTGSFNDQPFGVTALVTHGVGIAIGLLVGLFCFRGKKNTYEEDEIMGVPTSAAPQQTESGRLHF